MAYAAETAAYEMLAIGRGNERFALDVEGSDRATAVPAMQARFSQGKEPAERSGDLTVGRKGGVTWK
jgi:hypothetical protein